MDEEAEMLLQMQYGAEPLESHPQGTIEAPGLLPTIPGINTFPSDFDPDGLLMDPAFIPGAWQQPSIPAEKRVRGKEEKGETILNVEQCTKRPRSGQQEGFVSKMYLGKAGSVARPSDVDLEALVVPGSSLGAWQQPSATSARAPKRARDEDEEREDCHVRQCAKRSKSLEQELKHTGLRSIETDRDIPADFFPEGVPLDSSYYPGASLQFKPTTDKPLKRARDKDEEEELLLSQLQEHAKRLKSWQQVMQTHLANARRQLVEADTVAYEQAKLVEEIQLQKHSLRINVPADVSFCSNTAQVSNPELSASEAMAAQILPTAPTHVEPPAVGACALGMPSLSAAPCFQELQTSALPAGCPQIDESSVDLALHVSAQAVACQIAAAEGATAAAHAGLSIKSAHQRDAADPEGLLRKVPSPGQAVPDAGTLLPKLNPELNHPADEAFVAGTKTGAEKSSAVLHTGLPPLVIPPSLAMSEVSPQRSPLTPVKVPSNVIDAGLQPRLGRAAPKQISKSPLLARSVSTAGLTGRKVSKVPARMELDPLYARDAALAAAALAANDGNPAAALSDLLAQAAQAMHPNPKHWT